MYLRVTKSPEELPEEFALDDDTVEAVRFIDKRSKSILDMLRETCYELAQYQTRCEMLEQRLAKYEAIEEFEPKNYEHQLVSCE